MAFNPEIELKDFPCSFNLATGSKVSRQRLLHVRDNVRRDLKGDDCMPEERIRNLNLLTWALFNLNKKKEAQEINTEVLELTNRKNITALGNLVFLSCGLGNKINGKTYFKELQRLAESSENYEILKCNALGEQAYSYSRLGGVENYKHCIRLFKECIEKCPNNYLWKFGLGLVNRRFTNYNLHCSSPDKMDVHEITKECASLLFDVAENADDRRLRGLAYAQLVQLRQYNSRYEQDKIFKYKKIMDLLELALQCGSDNPSVLTMCGKSIKSINIDRSIVLLRDSLKIRENAIAYHHLGISLIRKVDLMASGKYSGKPKYVRQLTFSATSNIDQGNPSNIDLGDASNYRAVGAQAQRGDVFQDTENLDSGFCSNSNFTMDLLSQKFQNTLQVNKNPSTEKPTKYNSQGASKFYQTSTKKSQRGIGSPRNVTPLKKTPFVRHMSLQDTTSYSLSSMAQFAKSPTKTLDKDNALVQEALQNYEKALEVSQEENVTARLSLGELYMRMEQFTEALAQYNIIFERLPEGYLVSIISAYECAGKCLLRLSEVPGESESETYKSEAKEKFKKALSLAADLAIRNPLYANCKTKVWGAFRRLNEDIEKIPSQNQRYKEKIALLELAKNKDIANVIKEMLEQGLKLDDIDLFQKGLKCYLREGKFEDALAFLNMACTNSGLTCSEAWASPETLTMRATTYIATSWSRLRKNSPDSRRVFQQMFQLKYGHCAGMVNGEDEEELEKDKYDVLIVNDESDDSERQPGVTTTLSINLARVFEVIYGLDTSKNLERNVDYGRGHEEIQLEEMKNYSLVVLIVGDNDSHSYIRMLEATHKLKGPKFVVIFLGSDEKSPKILAGNKSVYLTDVHWQQTKLLDQLQTQDPNTSEVADKRSMSWLLNSVFNNNNNAVFRMFCLLVDEDFERHHTFLENPSQVFSN